MAAPDHVFRHSSFVAQQRRAMRTTPTMPPTAPGCAAPNAASARYVAAFATIHMKHTF